MSDDKANDSSDTSRQRWAAVVGGTLGRLANAPRVFSNWPAVWVVFVTATLTGRPKVMRFVSRAGTRVRAPSSITGRAAVFEVFVDDCYRMKWLLGPLADKSPLVVDVGAHVGAFSLRLLELCPSAAVHSYEPSASTVAYLQQNIADNAADITVHQAAVSAETGTAMFAESRPGSTINRLDAEDPDAKPVSTISFRDLLDGLPTRPALVKLDCEGAEYDVILGSNAEDWRGVDRVVMEYHPMPGRSWDDLERHFATLEFTTLAIDPSGPGVGLAWLARTSTL